jgi:hypothetical protein
MSSTGSRLRRAWKSTSTTTNSVTGFPVVTVPWSALTDVLAPTMAALAQG